MREDRVTYDKTESTEYVNYNAAIWSRIQDDPDIMMVKAYELEKREVESSRRAG